VTAPRCHDVRDELAWFVGGDLPAQRQRAVADHLRGCVACRCEAAALQQSGKALAAVASYVPDGADEPMFAAMHASILAAVDVGGIDRAGGETWLLRHCRQGRLWLQGLAAAALFLFGWWLVDAGTAPSLLYRPSLGGTNVAGAGKAVPYSGDRVQLQPLGEESMPDEADAQGAAGRGMMGRMSLRTLEDGDLVVPVHR